MSDKKTGMYKGRQVLTPMRLEEALMTKNGASND